jgi:hypothetical protein
MNATMTRHGRNGWTVSVDGVVVVVAVHFAAAVACCLTLRGNR